MKADHFRKMSEEQRTEYYMACAMRENAGAIMELRAFEKYLDKAVKVVRGRKVPVGTEGVVFWIGMANYSKYKNWWSWQVRVGIKDQNGVAYFISEDNITLV